MIDSDYCRTLAAYNQWANQTLYNICAGLTDEERRRDLGAPLGSIHITLNHLLYGDRAWLGRFLNRPYSVAAMGQELYSDFDTLRQEREATDAEIIAWAERITPEWLASPISYTSSLDGVTRTLPAWLMATHLFNHHTYHRGQITVLLSQLGHDHGIYDIPWMPPSES